MVLGGEVQEVRLPRLLSAVLVGSRSGEHSERAGEGKEAAEGEGRGDGQARLSRWRKSTGRLTAGSPSDPRYEQLAQSVADATLVTQRLVQEMHVAQLQAAQ